MFDLYGLKWPRSFEFVAVQRSVSELKVVIFAFGIVLTLLISTVATNMCGSPIR